MKALILTEASRQWGLGHVYRCLAFGQELAHRGYTVNWGLVGDEMCQEFATVYATQSSIFSSWVCDQIQVLIDDASFILIDSYHAPEELYGIASLQVPKCLWIADDYRLNFPKGFLLNSNDSIRFVANYCPNNESSMLSGFSYQPIRSEFLNPSPRITKDQVEHILIVMGGTDIHELTPDVILSTQQVFPQAEIHVIVPRLEQRIVWETRPDLHARFYPSLSALQLRSEMEWADLAISAGGQTIFELLHLGVPTVAIEVADNQHMQLIRLQKNDALVYLKYTSQSSFFDQLGIALTSIAEKSLRIQLSERGASIIDGQGVRRTLDRMGMD